MFRLLLPIVACLLLASCAPLAEPQFARCTLPVTRDAGMGVRVDDCAAWQIPPRRWITPMTR